MYLGAICIQDVFHIPIWSAVVSIAIFSALYTIFGGLKAIAFTDPIQVTFLVAGGLLTTYLAINAYGGEQGLMAGVGKMTSSLPDHFHMIFKSGDQFYDELPGLTVLIGAMWVVNLNYWGFNQYITQRALAAKSLDEAQKGIILAGFLKLLMPLVVVIPGIVVYGFYKQNDPTLMSAVMQNGEVIHDKAYPYLLNTFLFPGVKGLAFAALVAAIVGSLSSKTNSIATIFTMDIYKPFFGKDKSEKHLISVGQITTAASLVIAVPIAILIANNISKLGGGFRFIQEFTGFFSPGIFTIFLFGLFWKRATANGALAVAIATLPVSLLFYYISPLNTIPFLDRMGWCFLILSAVMVVTSLTNKQEADPKAITFSPNLFKTGPVFNIGALTIIAIIVFLYAKFW
jgi:SSS family solute:Na+ symporter